MGTGYTRNDTANNIADGNVINASDLDGEFDAIQSAFNGTTGHSHDGTSGEGPKIDTAGLADDAVTGAKIDSTTTITAAGFTGPLTGDVTGDVSGSSGSCTGNAATATKLATSRTLSISGDASGSASFDGSANAAISISLATDSVAANEIAANAVGASELNVSGNGTTSQFLRSDGDGTFTWATPTDTNTTYSAGDGLDLSSTTFSHADTSSQASVNNSGTTFIQDITLDTYGHITGIGSASVTIPDFVPSGTAMLFQQTSAPTGWTKSTTHNDKALRVVSGTASSGGTTAFSTAMGTPSVSGTVGISGSPAVGNLAVSVSGNIANTTLSVNTIPSHSHSYTRSNSINSAYPYGSAAGVGTNTSSNTGNKGNNGAHGHSHNLSGTLNGAPSVGNLAGSLSSATAAINVQYVDIIIATKD